MDIDSTATGFTTLKTLRIYQFDKDSIIEGHAEEDEVFVIVLVGTIGFTTVIYPKDESASTSLLSAPGGPDNTQCVAYLPPQAAYLLTCQTDSVVAYARATPGIAARAKVFFTLTQTVTRGLTVLFDEMRHARHLRVRLLQCDVRESDCSFMLRGRSEASYEALLCARISPETHRIAAASQDLTRTAWMNSWDAVASYREESLTVTVHRGCEALILLVMAI